MSRTLAPFGRRRATVSKHAEYGAYTVISCDDARGPVPDPGQFYMLAAAERWGGGADERPFLPRAFSVLRHHADGTLDFLLEEVGPGTVRLAELRPGDGLWLLGPLGAGFRAPEEGRRPLLVGGGVGIAPLAIWQDVLTRSSRTGTGAADAVVLLGFRDAEHAQGAALLNGPRIATDDGSSGHHGLVTELLRAELDRDPRVMVYACGPPPMLEAVRALCAAKGVPAQLALESGMACGFGACFGCVVPTRGGYVRLCVDGPVLDAAELEVVA
ncbi:MAG: dihydroorotate dehydrogenase electron transfer subunit [Solirubrobacteraceae bacterium]